MNYDGDFIQYLETIEKNEEGLYQYLKFFLNYSLSADYWAFNSLYDNYCVEYNIIQNPTHKQECKFYAFEYFYDDAIHFHWNEHKYFLEKDNGI
jgi:hypothetical protein